MQTAEKKVIAILGGGFAGVCAARFLGKKLKQHSLADRYRILLVDKNDYHTYIPTLYMIASMPKGSATTEEVSRATTVSFKEIFQGLPVEFCKCEIEKISFQRGDIHTSTGSIIQADFIISSLGSEVNYFEIESVARYGKNLKSLSAALAIREDLSVLVAGAERKYLRMVIVGGGPTAVELAGEMALICKKVCARKEENVCLCHVTLLTGDKPLLSQFGEKMSQRATKRLEKIGVVVQSGNRIVRATDSQLILSSGEMIPYDFFVWAGGVFQNEILKRADLSFEENSRRIRVTDYLEAIGFGDEPNYPRVYVVGDGAGVVNKKTGALVPMLARAAISQGSVAAHNLLEEIMADEGIIEAPKKKIFKAWDYPYVVPVGGLYGVAKFSRFVFSGTIAWAIKSLIELGYFISILGFFRGLVKWLYSVKIFCRKRKA